MLFILQQAITNLPKHTNLFTTVNSESAMQQFYLNTGNQNCGKILE